MRHMWFVPTPQFERSISINMLVRNLIIDVGCTFYNFIPKIWWQIFRLQHTSSHLLEDSILPLSDTILLRCVRNRVLHLDTCIFTIINEIRLEILTTIIIYEDLEFPPKLVFNQGLENLEVVKKFRR